MKSYVLFVQADSSNKISAIDSVVTQKLIDYSCPTCGIDNKTIDDSELSCKDGFLNYVYYRARIRGTRSYSVGGLVSLLQQWVQSGTAFITLYSTRVYLSTQCDTTLDSPTATDCLFNFQISTAISPPTSITPAKSAKTEFSGAQIGGLIVGVVIALLLLIFIILLVILIFRSRTHSKYVVETISA